MKKNYTLLSLLVTLIMFCTFQSNGQFLIPKTGTLGIIPTGLPMTLCSHLGCGSSYDPNANGYAVIYPGCGATTIVATYYVESCCDDIFIYNGVGTGGTQLANYFGGPGTFTFVAAPGQTITVQFTSDSSVQYAGLQATVTTQPNLIINSAPSKTVCSGSTVTLSASGVNTYTWSNSVISNTITETPQVGQYTYTVSGTSTVGAGCVLTETTTIYVNLTPQIAISGSTVVCGPGNISLLTVSGNADTYVWSDGSTGASIGVSPFQVTTYSVLGTVTQGGCKDSDFISVAFSPNPIVSVFANSTEICAGQSVNMFGIGADTYTWSTTSNGSQITVSPSVTTSYNLTGSNAYGCVGQTFIQVKVNPKPTLNVSSSESQICRGESASLNAAGAATYQWSSNTIFLSSASILVSPNLTTVYNVTGTDAKGCVNTATISLLVSECTGVDQNSNNLTGIQVYPNPTKGELTVEVNTIFDKTIEVIDLTGRLISSSNTADVKSTINMSNLASGIYYVKIKSGSATEVIKVVKD